MQQKREITCKLGYHDYYCELRITAVCLGTSCLGGKGSQLRLRITAVFLGISCLGGKVTQGIACSWVSKAGSPVYTPFPCTIGTQLISGKPKHKFREAHILNV